MIQTICVAGAGTMGTGIAQLTAQSGFNTLLFDPNPKVLEKAETTIAQNIRRGIDLQKITADDGTAAQKRITFISDAAKCIADFFIEAIIETMTAKTGLFNQLSSINHPGVIFATNTSSLSVSALQAGIVNPGRLAGMHFFNPAPLMKLVEIISGNQTTAATIQTIDQVCTALGKTAVHCRDTPGFIVNRVARHYYLEAMHMVTSGMATIEQVDILMESAGFRMGPFRLMDLIGVDINLAVTKSIYEAFGQPERFSPAAMQEEKVAKGELGRKTGRGFYTYPS